MHVDINGNILLVQLLPMSVNSLPAIYTYINIKLMPAIVLYMLFIDYNDKSQMCETAISHLVSTSFIVSVSNDPMSFVLC